MRTFLVPAPFSCLTSTWCVSLAANFVSGFQPRPLLPLCHLWLVLSQLHLHAQPLLFMSLSVNAHSQSLEALHRKKDYNPLVLDFPSIVWSVPIHKDAVPASTPKKINVPSLLLRNDIVLLSMYVHYDPCNGHLSPIMNKTLIIYGASFSYFINMILIIEWKLPSQISAPMHCHRAYLHWALLPSTSSVTRTSLHHYQRQRSPQIVALLSTLLSY